MSRIRFVLLGTVVLLALIGAAAQAPAGEFRLRDFLGRTWQNERVIFPLTEAQLAQVKAGHVLVGPDDKPVLSQLLPAEGTAAARLAFLADLNPFETRVYRLVQQKAEQRGDLKVEEAADAVILSNSKTGIRLPKTLKDGAGPFSGVRLLSGKWVSGSTLKSDQPVTAYTVQVLSRGPVSAEALCKATFVDNSTWQARIRLDAHEPVVLIDETSAVEGKASISLNLSKDFNPDTLVSRSSKGVLGRNYAWKITPGEAFVLEPWLHWWERDRQGNCCSLYREDGTDLLSIAAREAGAWLDPKLPREKQADIRIFFKQDAQGLQGEFPLKTGQRKWMFTTLDKAAGLPNLADEKTMTQAPLPYEYLVKHGHFPLDLVKDYTLTWKTDGVSYPHLLVTQKDVERFKKTVTDPTVYTKAIPRYINDRNPLNQFTMEEPIKAYFATGDVALGNYLKNSVLRIMQSGVDVLVKQDGLPLGTAPHHLSWMGANMLLADAVLSGNQITPEERERLLAQAAFIGYTVSRPEFWSPERHYSANPNMTTTVYGYQAVIACLLPTHPLAKEWVKKSMEELKGQLDNWSDDNGGWLEAPHYAMVSYDQILSAFVMARNAGFNDYLYDPKIKTVINWFSKISTPPDSRLGGFRHLPPLGNTYLQEACGEFALLAFLFRDRDPEFAAQMQWMFKQHRSWPWPGVGGAFPAFAGYRSLMIDPAIPEKAPPWKSELFPKTGLVLHGAFPSERETCLQMIQGTNHAHYDDDSGSVIIWGKGRIISDDFGYYNPARQDHNMVEAAVAGGIMHVKDFTPDKNLDYVQGIADGWSRQIAFVKDADPLGPNYFVFCDSFLAPVPATWRLHVVANKVTVGPHVAQVDGTEDVDTDIYFLQPTPLNLATESKARKANSGIFPDGRPGAIPMTQIAITATSPERYRALTAIVYPRLKTQAAPAVSAIADGKGVKIAHPLGVDYVFLSPEPFTYKEGPVAFEGMAGAIQVRNGKPILSLASGGSISYGSVAKKSAKPLPKVGNNLFPDGDFEAAEQKVINPDSGKYGVTATLFKGNPAKDDPAHPGKACLALKVPGERGVTGTIGRFAIDPTKVYRMSMQVFTTDALSLSAAGYGWNSKGAQMPWQWGLPGFKGPVTAWKTLETTVGPKGSGAKFTWPDDVLSTNIGMWINGAGTLYIDNVVVEEVKE